MFRSLRAPESEITMKDFIAPEPEHGNASDENGHATLFASADTMGGVVSGRPQAWRDAANSAMEAPKENVDDSVVG
jgi:hypothetical protein